MCVWRAQDERQMSSRLPIKSYIWDITNPNTPEHEIVPASPLCCLRFNPKVCACVYMTRMCMCLHEARLLGYALADVAMDCHAGP